MRTLTATKRASCVSFSLFSPPFVLTYHTRLSLFLGVSACSVATASPDAPASDTNTNPAATGRRIDTLAPMPTPRGMQELQAMDNSHVALVAVKLLADGFRQYRCVLFPVVHFLNLWRVSLFHARPSTPRVEPAPGSQCVSWPLVTFLYVASCAFSFLSSNALVLHRDLTTDAPTLNSDQMRPPAPARRESHEPHQGAQVREGRRSGDAQGGRRRGRPHHGVRIAQ